MYRGLLKISNFSYAMVRLSFKFCRQKKKYWYTLLLIKGPELFNFYSQFLWQKHVFKQTRQQINKYINIKEQTRDLLLFRNSFQLIARRWRDCTNPLLITWYYNTHDFMKCIKHETDYFNTYEAVKRSWSWKLVRRLEG